MVCRMRDGRYRRTQLKKWECAVLLPPSLSTKPNSADITNPAKTLHDAGVEIGFAIGDSTTSVRSIFYNLMQLVRAGLPADVAIKAVTHVPAKALGIDKRTGTLEEGKDADTLEVEDIYHRHSTCPPAPRACHC